MKKLILVLAITLTGCAAQEYHSADIMENLAKYDVVEEMEKENSPLLVCFGDQEKVKAYIRDSSEREIAELKSKLGTYTTEREIMARIDTLDLVYGRQFLIDHIDNFSIDGLSYSDAEMCKKYFADNRDYLLSLK